MGRQGDLERELTNLLKGMDEGSYTSPSTAFPGQKVAMAFKSDGMLLTESRALVLEVEVGQTHPDTNVGKYWPLLEMEADPLERLVLVHVIASRRSNVSRLALAQFYVDKMKQSFGDRFRYIRIPCDGQVLSHDEIKKGAEDALAACFKELFGAGS